MAKRLFEEYLNPDEDAEPLGDGHYIIQSKNGYRFGSDAVALAHFASEYVKSDSRVFDMCSGCGIIGIMLAIDRGCTVSGAEIDGALHSMSMRSCKINGLNDVNFLHADVRALDCVAPASFDVVVCNPPYYKADSKPASVAPAANSELTVTLKQIVSEAKRLLKVGGSLFMVHISSRIDEVVCACSDVGLTVKNLIINPNGKTFMLRAVRGGKQGSTLTVKEF